MNTVRSYCTSDKNLNCPAKANADLVDLIVVHYFRPEGLAALHRKLKCPLCGDETDRVMPTIPKKKRFWPYYNSSTGVTFESESHENKYVKEHKLEAV